MILHMTVVLQDLLSGDIGDASNLEVEVLVEQLNAEKPLLSSDVQIEGAIPYQGRVRLM